MILKSKTNAQSTTRYVLSIDGGGIRGIIPATVLAEMEKRANKPIWKMFDLMTGTSTGGLIVAALAKKNPFSAYDVVNMYRNAGSRIFSTSGFKKVISYVIGVPYSYEILEKVLNSYFGDETFSNSNTNMSVVSYDIQNNVPFFFKSWEKDTEMIKLKYALRASTAAPTYFVPMKMYVHNKERIFIDGGIFANNPAMCAYVSCKRLFPDDNIQVLSLGTGKALKNNSYVRLQYLGKLGWIEPLLDVMFASDLTSVNYQLTSIISDNYVRVQTELDGASLAIDNATKTNIKFLEGKGREMYAEHETKINKFFQNNKN